MSPSHFRACVHRADHTRFSPHFLFPLLVTHEMGKGATQQQQDHSLLYGGTSTRRQNIFNVPVRLISDQRSEKRESTLHNQK
jgi:hypothetical protein